MKKSVNTEMFITVFDVCCEKLLLKKYPKSIPLNKKTAEFIIKNNIELLDIIDCVDYIDCKYINNIDNIGQYIKKMYKLLDKIHNKLNDSNSILYSLDEVVILRDELVDMIVNIYQNIDYKKMLNDME